MVSPRSRIDGSRQLPSVMCNDAVSLANYSILYVGSTFMHCISNPEIAPAMAYCPYNR